MKVARIRNENNVWRKRTAKIEQGHKERQRKKLKKARKQEGRKREKRLIQLCPIILSLCGVGYLWEYAGSGSVVPSSDNSFLFVVFISLHCDEAFPARIPSLPLLSCCLSKVAKHGKQKSWRAKIKTTQGSPSHPRTIRKGSSVSGFLDSKKAW